MSAADDSSDSKDEPSIDIEALLSNGADELQSTTGAQLVGLLAVVGAVGAVLWEAMAVLVGNEILDYVRETVDMSNWQVRDTVERGQDAVDGLGYGLDLSVPEILVGLLIFALLSEAVMIVAARSFARAELDGVPASLAMRRLPIATLFGAFGGMLLWIATFVGLVLLVVPGVLLFIGTLFYRQEIAIADKGPIQAVSGTWELTKRNRVDLIALIVVLLVFSYVVGTITGIVTGPIGVVLNAIGTSIVSVFSIAVVTGAYLQLSDDADDLTASSL